MVKTAYDTRWFPRGRERERKKKKKKKASKQTKNTSTDNTKQAIKYGKVC